MKTVKTLADIQRLDNDGNPIEKNDLGFLLEYLRGQIDSAFADQKLKNPLGKFRSMLDRNKYRDYFYPQVDEFGEGKNLRFALLKIDAEYADIIEKNRERLNLLGRKQFGSCGQVHLLLKRKIGN